MQQQVLKPSPNLPSSLKIETQSQLNRTLVSTQLIPKNKILLECEPIATAILSTMRDRVCDGCLVVTTKKQQQIEGEQATRDQMSKCGSCRFVYYCSRQCQKACWKLHKHECQIFKKIVQAKNVKAGNIIAEFILNVRIWILRGLYAQVERKILEMVNLLQYHPPDKTQKFQQLSVILLENLNMQKSAQNMKKAMFQIATLSINCFTIQDYLCTEQSIAIGLYYPCNFMNNSCQPNCQQIFQGPILKIRTLKAIQKGDQVNICYVGRLGDFDQRRDLLKYGYLFICFCSRCQVQKMYDWKTFYLQCPNCDKQKIRREGYGKISEKQLKEDGLIDNQEQDDENDFPDQQVQKHRQVDEEKNWVGKQCLQESNSNKKQVQAQKPHKKLLCEQCKQIMTEQELKDMLKQCQRHSEQILNPDNSYKTIKKQFFAMKKLLSYNCPKYEQLLNRIYLKCLDQAKSQNHPEQASKLYEQAYILLKDLLQNVPIWYQTGQSEQIPYFYGWKYAELGKLAYFLSSIPKKKNKITKAAQYTQKSYEILKPINFSTKLLQVQQLQKRYQQIKIAMSFRKSQILNKKR